MTDFVRRMLRPERDDWIIRSLLDTDFYEFPMGYFFWKYFRGTHVTLRLINRNPRLPLARLIDEGELRAQLDHVRTLRFRRNSDISYLRGMDVYGEHMLEEGYLQFLSNEFSLPPYDLRRVGDQWELTFSGPCETTMAWELYALPVVIELFTRTALRGATRGDLEILYGRATDRLYGKLRSLKRSPRIRFSDFGHRRRHSHLWQRRAIEMAMNEIPEQFLGTSNVFFANALDLKPMGTNAHKGPMMMTALADTDEEKRQAQYEFVRKWIELFPHKALWVTLPDTYGSRQFRDHMPPDLAKVLAQEGRAERIDSGNPVKEAHDYISWVCRNGGDPHTKMVIPSDGLDVPEMILIDEKLSDKIMHPYGLGTNLTNAFAGCHPRSDEMAEVNGESVGLTWGELIRGQSVVIKIDSAEGRPCVKLSNNVNKATGRPSEVERYLRIFGGDGRVAQKVEV